MSNVLREALFALYRDSPEILYFLERIDFTSLSCKFNKEIDARIDRTTYDEVEKFLASDKYLRYTEAVNSASMAMTQELAKLIEFALTERRGELN